jgi:hypothetical protein
MRRAWLQDRLLELRVDHLIGTGGEAEVYDLGDGTALKLYRCARDLDRGDVPERVEQAERRLARIAGKLKIYPRGLPPRVVAPLALATDGTGRRVVGYTMRLVPAAPPLARWAAPQARAQGTTAAAVTRVFSGLRETLLRLHAAGVVVGDFNDLNVLVTGTDAWLIDADSYQFGPFLCDMFTERFTDPRLCDPTSGRARPVKPYDEASDWYAFHVMLFRALTGTDPYAGVHRPALRADWVPQGARPLERLSVLHPEVEPPRVAPPPEALGARLLAHFDEVLHRDARGPVPAGLLEGLRWTLCLGCGLEHASPDCPRCRAALLTVREPAPPVGLPDATPAPWAVPPTPIDRAGPGAASPRYRELARTAGRIIEARLTPGGLAWLAWEHGAFVRETGQVVLEGPLQPQLRVALAPAETLIAVGEQGVLTGVDGAAVPVAVETCDGRPQLASDGSAVLWLGGGWLRRLAPDGPARLLQVAPRRTRIWAAPGFGLALTQVERPAVALPFDPATGGHGAPAPMSPLSGHWFDVGCAIGARCAWLFVTAREAGRDVAHAVVLDRWGRELAAVHGEPEGVPWLVSGALGCVVGDALLVPTDDGVGLLQVQEGEVRLTRTWPETAPWVHAQTRLLLRGTDILAVGRCAIHVLGLRVDGRDTAG